MKNRSKNNRKQVQQRFPSKRQASLKVSLFFDDEQTEQKEMGSIVSKNAAPCKIEEYNFEERESCMYAQPAVKLQNNVKMQSQRFDLSEFERQNSQCLIDTPSTGSKASTVRKKPIYTEMLDEQFSDFSYDDYYEPYKGFNQLELGIKEENYQKGMKIEQDNVKIEGKRKRGDKRKTRTTITLQKLQQLNKCLRTYYQQKNRGIKPDLSLKQIAIKLNLSHSTTLHKANIFKRNKVLQPGKFLSSLTKKRKYKKSEQCQRYINIALTERPFYSAEAVAKYIFRRWQVSYPRAVIGRHLSQIGYSSNNIKAFPLERNGAKYIEMRKQYADILQQITEHPFLHIYVDQVAFSRNLFRPKTTYTPYEFRKQMEQTEKDYVSLMVAVSAKRVIHYNIKQGFYNKSDFIEAIADIHKAALQDLHKNGLSRILLINDMHKIHYDNPQTDKVLTEKTSIDRKLNRLGIKRIFLPPGSPQLNPVEMMVSYLKTILLETKTREQIKSCAILKEKIDFYMREDIAKKQTDRFFFQFNKWFKKAQNEEAF